MSTHSFIRETGPRPQEGGPPRSAIRGGGPLGLRRVPQGSLRQAAAGCSGRTRRLALDLCGANPLLRPLLVRRAAARHEGARSRRPCGHRHPIMVPAATIAAGAAPFPPAEGRTGNRAI